MIIKKSIITIKELRLLGIVPHLQFLQYCFICKYATPQTMLQSRVFVKKNKIRKLMHLVIQPLGIITCVVRRQITRKNIKTIDSQISLSDRNRIDYEKGVFGSNNLKYEVNRSGNAQEYYQPEGGKTKVIDLTKDAKISLNPNDVFSDVPVLRLREFSPRYSSGIQNLFSVAGIVADAINQNDLTSFVKSYGGVRNPLASSLIGTKTGFVYKLPLLVDKQHSFVTQFGDGENGGGGIFSDLVGGIKEGLLNNPAFSPIAENGNTLPYGKLLTAGVFSNLRSTLNAILPAVSPMRGSDKFYTGSSPVAFDYTCTLINTGGSDYEQMLWHKNFLHLISHNAGTANISNRFVGSSSCIYELEIVGGNGSGDNIMWMPAVKMDVSYEGRGSFKTISGYSFSEAVDLTLNITSFFPPMRVVEHNFVNRGIRLHAINTSERLLCDTLQKYLQAVRGVDFKG